MARTQYHLIVVTLPAEFTFVEQLSEEISNNIWIKQNADSLAFPLNIDFHNMNIYFSVSIIKQVSYTHVNNSYKFQISYQPLILLFLCFVWQGLQMVKQHEICFIFKYFKYIINICLCLCIKRNNNIQLFGIMINNNCSYVLY